MLAQGGPSPVLAPSLLDMYASYYDVSLRWVVSFYLGFLGGPVPSRGRKAVSA
jgi:hypothetical protein